MNTFVESFNELATDVHENAVQHGWYVAEAVVAKAKYNKTRPFKHGGKEF